MSDLSSLGYTSISDKSRDEALEELRQIRLRRRTPIKQTVKKLPAKTEEKKAVKKQMTETISPEFAKEMLALLGEE